MVLHDVIIFQLHAERHYGNYEVLINGIECIKQMLNYYSCDSHQ